MTPTFTLAFVGPHLYYLVLVLRIGKIKVLLQGIPHSSELPWYADGGESDTLLIETDSDAL